MPSKSKSRDQRSGKEQNASSRASATVNAASRIPARGYNPGTRTFHTLETPSTTSVLSFNVLRNLDETDDSDHDSDSSNETDDSDYHSYSSNDSESVGSEEPREEISDASLREEVITGAQQLDERCCEYLMSRKIEAYNQQVEGMGFPAERAREALLLNKGRVEEAVPWLFENGAEADGQKDQNLDSGDNLEIDISEEVARIFQMVFDFNCSKEDVERAVLFCEGDLDKAEETLRSKNHNPPSTIPSKVEEGCDTAESSPTSEIQPTKDVITPTEEKRLSGASNPSESQHVPTAGSSEHENPQPGTTLRQPVDVAGSSEHDNPQPGTTLGEPVDVAGSSEHDNPQSGTTLGEPVDVAGSSEHDNPQRGTTMGEPVDVAGSSEHEDPQPGTTLGEPVDVAGSSEHENPQLGTTMREPVDVIQRPQPVVAPATTRIRSSLSASAPIFRPPSHRVNIQGAHQPNASLDSINMDWHIWQFLCQRGIMPHYDDVDWSTTATGPLQGLGTGAYHPRSSSTNIYHTSYINGCQSRYETASYHCCLASARAG